MLQANGKNYRQFLSLWTRWVTAKPWLVVVGAVALTVASLTYLTDNMAIDTSTGDMLSEKLDFRIFNKEMDEAFPLSTDSLLVVIDGQTADLADATARQLVNTLRAQPELFHHVYDLAGEPYFRRNGLLYLDLDALYELSDRIAEAQPFLASLWRDPSLAGLFALLTKALQAGSGTKGGAPIEIDPLLNRISAVAEAQVNQEFAELSWRSLVQNDNAQADGGRRFILVEPTFDFGSLQPASDAMDRIRELVLTLGFTSENGLRVRLSGPAALEQEELESVEEGMGLAGILSLVLVIVLLIVGLRTGWMVICCLLTLVMGLVWTGAFAIFALGALNLISVAFAVLFIGLSVDFGIHYSLRYGEENLTGQDRRTALGKSAAGVGGALTLSAVGAAIAFYSFLPTDYNGLAELGLIAGTGMFIAFFANMTLLPALLMLRAVPGPPIDQGLASGSGRKPDFRQLISNHFRTIIVCFLVLGVAALTLVPNVEFDFDPLNLKNRQTESMATLIDLMSDSRTSPYTINVLAEDLQQGTDMAKQLAGLDTIESAETIADYVPVDQDEKLEVISTMALFLAPAFNGKFGAQKNQITPQTALSDFVNRWEEQVSGDAQKRLLAVLSKLTDEAASAQELEQRLLVHLPNQLTALRESLNAGYVNLENLPESLRQRKISADGRVLVDVFPKYDVTNQQRLTTFVESVRTVAPRATGSPVVILEAGRAILKSFYQAGSLSAGLIAIMLFVVLGNLRDVCLVFAPLFLAGLFTLAASVLFGLAFNFANVIVLPLLFGLGVAGGIHLVLRERASLSKGTSSSTPRAVLFSALTTMGSFGSIALSAHPGTASMGTLLTIAIIATLLCTLIFLPALMVVFKPDLAKGD